MKRFQSFEDFEKKFINEEIPQTDLNKHVIMENINNKYENKGKIGNGMKWAVIAMILSILVIPALSNENLSYAEIYKNITESIYGKIIAFLPDKGEDGGFKLISTKSGEEEIRRYEKINTIVGETYDKIKEQLKPGECARMINLEFYEATGSAYIVEQPLVFKDINSIIDYGLDISIPKYIPKGYKFKEARLNFTPNCSSQESMARNDVMAEEARKQNLLYIWEKVEDKIEYNLVMEYIPKRKAYWNKSINVEINLTDYDAATQALVSEGSDYSAEIINIEDREILQWNYGSEDLWRHYTFKMSNRKYKTYDITIAKDNPLSNKEIKNMIRSFQ